jgi:hypothetical protein
MARLPAWQRSPTTEGRLMRFSKRSVAATTVAAGFAVLAGSAGAVVSPVTTGPSTTTAPYLLPLVDGVQLTSLLTVDDAGKAKNGYEMVGIPDGLGARLTPDGHTLDVTMNQELTAPVGTVRRHGQQGAFVSELRIDSSNNKVNQGSDFIDPGVRYWDYLTGSYATTPNAAGTQADGDVFPAFDARFARFCSASLTDPGQLFNAATGKGYSGQIRFANEENGVNGRVFGITPDGVAQQLPRLGLFSWENTNVAQNASDTTLVMGNEDDASGQLWAYTGTKTKKGSAFDKAGLTNGTDFVVDLLDEAVSTDAGFRTTYGLHTPAPFDLAEVDWNQSGSDQNVEAAADGLSLNRIEDGAFDPSHPNDFYFVTTAGGSGTGGGLWRLSWNDIDNPSAGGTLTLLLDGTEGGLVSIDNIDVDTHGNVIIQEDPGNNAHVAIIAAYRISDGALGKVATFDPNQFTPAAPGFITQDEESSGIIDIENLTGVPGDFLFDAQVHTPPVNNATEYVERGQLLRMQVTDWNAVYSPTAPTG